jgi:NAD(P)-dependent dehydrogenase (short-subunit alcohol dehydrogenase family)
MNIDGKTAVVTGGGSGIGRATALALMKAGARVVIADIDEDRLKTVCSEGSALGGEIVAFRADVSKLDDVQGLFDKSISTMGQVDIIMNNAGVHISGPVEKIPIADWEWIVGINLWGVINGVNVFLPHMLERESGYIVNTASIAGLSGVLDASIPYTMTKFAVMGLSESLAVYLRPKGVGVSVVCPGLVTTNIAGGSRRIPVGDGLDDVRDAVFEAFSRGDLPLPSDIEVEVLEAEAVADLVVSAIEEERFLVCTHANTDQVMLERAQDLDALITNQARLRQERMERFSAFLSARLSEQDKPEGNR